MKQVGGFTLIEVLVVLVIVSILSSLSLFFYQKYHAHAVKTHLISDLRHCLEEIAINVQAGNNDIPEIVKNCPKSKYTQSIELLSTNPIQLKATGKALVKEVSCSYDENVGSVGCNFD